MDNTTDENGKENGHLAGKSGDLDNAAGEFSLRDQDWCWAKQLATSYS